MSDVIYTDAKRSKVAKGAEVEALCGSSDPSEAFPHILTKGTFAYTTEELAAKREAKRRWIIHHLQTSYLNPKNDLPYSATILEAVFDELRLIIDPVVPVEVLFGKMERKFMDKLPLKPLDKEAKETKTPKEPRLVGGGKPKEVKEKWKKKRK